MGQGYAGLRYLFPLGKTCQGLLALTSHGAMPPAVPMSSLGACFAPRGDKVCICFLMQDCFFWACFRFTYLLTTASALAIPCKESALYLGEGNLHPPLLGAQSCPSSRSPQLQLLIPGLAADRRRLQKVPDWVWVGDLSFRLLFSQLATPPLCVSPFVRIIFRQRGPWHLCFSLDLCHGGLRGPNPTSENVLRVPGVPWS